MRKCDKTEALRHWGFYYLGVENMHVLCIVRVIELGLGLGDLLIIGKHKENEHGIRN